MKINKFLLGAFALSVGFASCSDDDLVKGNDVSQTDETRYMMVQICAPAQASRAFEDGPAHESEVNRIDFIFYDALGNPTSEPQYFTNVNEAFKPDADDNITKIWTSVVPVNLVQGQNLPYQVICLVNAQQENVNNIKDKNLSELRDREISYFTTQNEFMMSNSVYFGTNLSGPNQRICATTINPNSQLFPSEEEAKKIVAGETPNEAALVNIYVERLAAKVGLTMAENAPQGYTLTNSDGGTVTLNFHPEYWFMNAVAKNNYVTKRYGVLDENGKPVMQPTFAQVNAKLDWTWNDEPNHRSYWGCSPSYYTNSYPSVSDQVFDVEPATDNSDNYNVKYYSYNEVVAQANGKLEGENAPRNIANQAIAGSSFNNAYIYTRETTVAINTINDINTGNPAAAVASAVVVGNYTAGDATAPSTFYIDSSVGENGTYYNTEAKAIAALAKRQNIVYSDNGTTLAPANIFSIQHPAAAVRGENNIAGRLVTLQLASEPNGHYYYWANGQWTLIDENNYNEVNKQLLSVGYMSKFNNGRAFFSVPIRHLAFNSANYDNATGLYDWANLKAGELGVVRNHVYNLTISSIKGLGTGLRSDDQPIVPAKEEANQYVAVRLNVLSWNIVPSWSVDL